MDYYRERDINNIKKIQILLNELPYFCSEYFVGIEQSTSTLTRLNYAHDLKTFFTYLHENILIFKNTKVEKLSISDLEKITISHIENFLSYLSFYDKDGINHTNKEASKSRKLSSIRHMLAYFYNKEKIAKNVGVKVKNPKLHKKEIIRLKENEANDLIETVTCGKGLTNKEYASAVRTKERDLALITLLLSTGIRISECVGLNISDINLEEKQFKVKRKGGNEQILYFNDIVKDLLETYINDERMSIQKDIELLNGNTEPLFFSLQKKRMSTRAIQNLVKKFAKIVTPLKNITPHKLRSTFGTTLYSKTGDIYLVADILGHKDVNTTVKHYVAKDEDKLRDAADLIDFTNKPED